MKKSTKIISTAIALVLVMSFMVIGILAATAANAGITANVSWTATEGIAFELEAWVVNNASANGIGATTVPKSITKQIVTASTSNTTANNLAGDLACGFYDGSNDGVNNPSNIIFTYKIKNTGSGILKVTATKTPNNQAESGTTAASHKPAVALSSKLDGTNNTSSCISSITGNGFNIPAGKTLEYIVTLSISNADLSISSFDAGVTFSFGTGGVEAGTPTIYINGVQQSNVAIDGATTVGDYLDALDGSQYPGYFYDEDLTIYAGEDDIVTNDTKLYTKPATLDQLTFVDNNDNTYSAEGIFDKKDFFHEDCLSSGDIIIPKTYAGKNVVKVSSFSSVYESKITSIVLPNTVTSINIGAFEAAVNMVRATIPDSVTSIGYSAFSGCRSLNDIVIPNDITSIDKYTFANCSSLNKIIIPKGVTSIGDSAFSDCTSLTSIMIPDSVTSIGYRAFSGCTSLTNITIPDSVTSIGASAFSFCTGLTSIYIPSSVTTIATSDYNYSPFYRCSSSLKIYCGASSKPSGWGTYWNYYDSGKTLSVTRGVTREVYNSTYA